MAGTQISTSVTSINSLLGFQAISLSNIGLSAATVITAGSKIELSSAFFNFPSDETPQATTWTAITTANTAYITLTPSGTSGSQILTAKWNVNAPAWSDSKQGWYASATSTIRYIGGPFKSGTSSYEHKFILDDGQERPSNALLYSVIRDIGDWKMNTDLNIDVAHGLGADFKNIRSISVIIRSDDDALYLIYATDTGGATIGQGVYGIDSTNISLRHDSQALWNTTTYSSIGFNRGWVTLQVES